MHISVDHDVCTGHGRCYVVAGELIESDDEGRGVVRWSEVPSALEPQARKAVANCPERAVALDV